MKYVCNVCGHEKDEFELKCVTETHGEAHIDYSCKCCDKGEYVRATRCPVCGRYFDNEELFGVCECCLEKYETVEEALKIGEINQEKTEINGFIACILSHKQINNILTKYVEEHFTDHSRAVIDYCEEDKSYYSDWIKKYRGE